MVDLRLARRLGRLRLAVDLLDVTGEVWREVGLLLAGFDGSREAFVLPASGAGARLTLAWER